MMQKKRKKSVCVVWKHSARQPRLRRRGHHLDLQAYGMQTDDSSRCAVGRSNDVVLLRALENVHYTSFFSFFLLLKVNRSSQFIFMNWLNAKMCNVIVEMLLFMSAGMIGNSGAISSVLSLIFVLFGLLLPSKNKPRNIYVQYY